MHAATRLPPARPPELALAYFREIRCENVARREMRRKMAGKNKQRPVCSNP
jgi:hypothetical protein